MNTATRITATTSERRMAILNPESTVRLMDGMTATVRIPARCIIASAAYVIGGVGMTPDGQRVLSANFNLN